MTTVNQETIKKVAHLARLKINDEESKTTAAAITEVLNLVEKINTANVEDVHPLANPLDNNLTPRADAVSESNQREALLLLAPSSEAGLYLVPQVIE
ncbi:MAG: Asp-tRNA(Asn)/Glu-tRNA(Gln) amidotransferase GatCAB subunit C [Legionellales bacterium]|nr:Asp-tRNA(Asn)/Glu-tRNA(Gln) amidotransferase GatCAB subunit C [Legionellales bacterium]|tara:strand:+ start:708 stop:998 length:291 start_codon:yes stop_codon:yes gene_type:complete